MTEELKSNICNPEMLEKMYRDNPSAFEEEFEKIYPEISNLEIAKFWKARLEYSRKTDRLKTSDLPEVIIVITICIITALLIKIPDFFHIGFPESMFYQKNAAAIVFLGLVLYMIRINRISGYKKIITIAAAFIIPVVYSNLLPSVDPGDSVNLVYIHLPLLFWCILGIVFIGFDYSNNNKRIDFIRYSGDLIIIYALIAITGGLLTAVTIGLFNSIGLNIEKFYSENIVLTGAVAAPVVAAFIIRAFPGLVTRIAPVIASVFSPLVLITLITFLISIAFTGKNPYKDRDFLLIFNIMLLGVMGIIVFSVSEASVIKNQKFNGIILFSLSVITIVVDLIALSAIFYRLGEYGLTPNRLAVLGSNLLVLINLVLIMIDLFKVTFKKCEFRKVEMSVAKFLPVYLGWIIIVIFGFPFIFGMK
ncbi:MAG TPA: hypothetical protein PLQ61_10490 [Bacteroidales bacterium]|nr:hypothetical protein [Bacteroidales bacterium]HQG53841.1 hypothetical protein [Bacteroidales bacterium]HQJ21603.1 hypothetical protein [Bacteroidales bacterium]